MINAEAFRTMVFDYNINAVTANKIQQLCRKGYTSNDIEAELNEIDRAAFIRFSFNNH